MDVSACIALKELQSCILHLPRACASIECPNVQDLETGKHALLVSVREGALEGR
jgi:hypothetical protein